MIEREWNRMLRGFEKQLSSPTLLLADRIPQLCRILKALRLEKMKAFSVLLVLTQVWTLVGASNCRAVGIAQTP